MKAIISILFVAIFIAQLDAQPYRLEGDFGSGWSTYVLDSRVTTSAITVQASTTNTNANFLFNNSNTDYNPKWCGSNAPNVYRNVNTLHSGGAYHYSGGGWDQNLEVPITNTYYYTFIIGKNSSTNNDLSILETNFNPNNITNVTEPGTVTDMQSATITVTLSAAINTGEKVFVRWTNDSWGTSSMLEVTSFNASHEGEVSIPGHSEGTSIEYYALSTNQAEVEHSTADYFTLRLNNNSGSNYSYTVAAEPNTSTKLTTESCGATINDMVDYIYCDEVTNANNYQYKFVHSGSGYSQEIMRSEIAYGGANTTYLALNWVPGIEYGKTYDVQVKAKVGSNWGDYGDVCQVTTAALPTTKLTTASCGSTTNNLDTYVYCDQVGGASDYQYNFVNAGAGINETVTRSSISHGTGYNTNLSLLWVPNLQYNLTYDVQVRAKVGDSWGSYGDVCQVTVSGNVPSTKLNTGSCGLTTDNINQYIYCDAVSGADNYEYLFEHAGSGYSQSVQRSSIGYGSSSSNQMNLMWVPGLEYSKTYDVQVRALVNGVWGNYGDVCQITINDMPTTKIAAAYCGMTATSLNTYFYCDMVPGADDYEYLFVHAGSGYSETRTRSSVPWGQPYYRNMNLVWIPGMESGKTYDVQVRAKVGDTWGSYGDICQITVDVSKSSSQTFDLFADNTFIELRSYPNPFTYEAKLNVNSDSESPVNVSIIDVTGTTVERFTVEPNREATIGDNLKPGVYIIKAVTVDGKVSTIKVIKT